MSFSFFPSKKAAEKNSLSSLHSSSLGWFAFSQSSFFTSRWRETEKEGDTFLLIASTLLSLYGFIKSASNFPFHMGQYYYLPPTRSSSGFSKRFSAYNSRGGRGEVSHTLASDTVLMVGSMASGKSISQHRWLAIVQQWIGVTIYESHDKSVDPCHLWGIYSHVTAKGKIPEVTKARCTKVVIRMMAWWQYKLDGHSLMIIQQISEIVNQKSMNGEDLL